MSIHEEVAFDKEGKPLPSWQGRELLRSLFIPLLVVLVGLLGYGLGRLSGAGQKGSVEIKYDPNIISALSSSTPKESVPATGGTGGPVYASSKGTKYYYAGCKNTISAANKVSFSSAAAAEAAGYTVASNCKP